MAMIYTQIKLLESTERADPLLSCNFKLTGRVKTGRWLINGFCVTRRTTVEIILMKNIVCGLQGRTRYNFFKLCPGFLEIVAIKTIKTNSLIVFVYFLVMGGMQVIILIARVLFVFELIWQILTDVKQDTGCFSHPIIWHITVVTSVQKHVNIVGERGLHRVLVQMDWGHLKDRSH